MASLPKGQRHPVELRERATRMVLEHGHEYPSQWKAIESIAEKFGIHRETLRLWVRRARAAGVHPLTVGRVAANLSGSSDSSGM